MATTRRTYTSNDLTFERWYREVNRICMRRIGLGVEDLADFASYDTWESGATPLEGFEACLEAQDGADDLLELFFGEE